MAQTTILAAGVTAATSTDVAVAAGASVTIGIFTADTNGIPANTGVQVYIDTPSADRHELSLNGSSPTAVLQGPGTFRVKRGVVGTSIGVYTES